MRADSFVSGCLTTITVALGAVLLYHGCQRDRTVVSSEKTTEIVYDTIPVFIDTPVPTDSVVLRYKTVCVPLYDTTKVHHAGTLASDSTSIVLPITQKHYSDSTYEAWVSGYDLTLDSIKIFQPVMTITNTITNTKIKYKQKRWGLGVQVGIGITPSKIEPYIGAGIIYNIFSW